MTPATEVPFVAGMEREPEAQKPGYREATITESDFERGMRAGARYGGYHEAPKNGGSASWQKWMMTLLGGLAVIGIGGVVGMYGKLSAVEANQISQQKQLDNLTQMVLNLTRRNQ